MNIVTQFPVNLNLNFANPQTESAQRQQAARELISQTEQASKRDAEKGLNNENEQASTKQAPLTYDYIKAQKQNRDTADFANNLNSASEGETSQQDGNPTDQQSQGRELAEQAQQSSQQSNQQFTEAELKKIAELQARDQEVRVHEQAHANAGGQYAGSPSYDYERGPDGKNYAVGGEVKIDVSEVPNDPQATVQKMEQVQRAALAPAEPSNQDRKVAAEAAQKQQAARQEVLQKNVERLSADAQVENAQTTQANTEAQNVAQVIKAEDIQSQGINVQPVPTFQARASLKAEELDAEFIPTLDTSPSVPTFAETIEQSDPQINSRALKIQRFYNTNSIPNQNNLSAYA
ncbi:catalase [Catenovulum sp. SM1970]|uniref:putative metalloprotease CJM1_0395 family protein n=1 Tax=Marinifaba aquimaris TaxID=2741323 RepID=UPI001572F414|nr:putative metalloprotease CJM1_0395 family protein [Marinifaba aquimaris]NTS75738.1 catalase [Marinifaba aquimaris]